MVRFASAGSRPRELLRGARTVPVEEILLVLDFRDHTVVFRDEVPTDMRLSEKMMCTDILAAVLATIRGIQRLRIALDTLGADLREEPRDTDLLFLVEGQDLDARRQ